MIDDIILATVQVFGAVLITFALACAVSYTIATLPTEEDD